MIFTNSYSRAIYNSVITHMYRPISRAEISDSLGCWCCLFISDIWNISALKIHDIMLHSSHFKKTNDLFTSITYQQRWALAKNIWIPVSLNLLLIGQDLRASNVGPTSNRGLWAILRTMTTPKMQIKLHNPS